MYEEQFSTLLRANNMSVTPERIRLFNVLASATEPISTTTLIDKSRKFMNKTTVYRNIDLFEKLGITHRVYAGWKYTIELSDLFSPHHHHITCTQCGKIRTFHEPRELDEQLHNIARESGFELNQHSLELRGICGPCSVE